VQYDPVHAALPWAGVAFILLVHRTYLPLLFWLARDYFSYISGLY